MSDPISPELFDKLVDLAALQLDEDEAIYLRAELNKQLLAIDELVAIPLDENIPLTSHGVPYSTAIKPDLRLDESIECPEAEDILGQAPNVDDRYIVVPDIPHEKLD